MATIHLIPLFYLPEVLKHMERGEKAEVCVTAGKTLGLLSTSVLKDSQFLFDHMIFSQSQAFHSIIKLL